MRKLFKALSNCFSAMKRIGTSRRKTRNIYKKKKRQKGKLGLTKFFQAFDKGDSVVMKAEHSIQKGMYFRRCHGKLGKVLEKQGKCYKVAVKDGNKPKTLIVHPVHLKKV